MSYLLGVEPEWHVCFFSPSFFDGYECDCSNCFDLMYVMAVSLNFGYISFTSNVLMLSCILTG